MEHRLRSPSRTYSDMPEVRRAHGDGRNHTHHSSARPRDRVAVESSAYAEARKNGIFLPSSEYIAELLLGGDSPEPQPDPDSDASPVRESTPSQPPTPPATADATPDASPDTTADSGQSDNPTPGSSRQTPRREGLRQRVPKDKPQNQRAAAPPTPTRTTRSSARRASAGAAETSGATVAAPTNYEDVEVIVVEDSDSESQSSAGSSRNRSFFKESRLPYSAAEDEEILKFVLTGSNIEKTGSILLWKELEVIKGNPKRTYQSLKNRFLRNIKPYILTRFNHLLTPESLRMLKGKFPEMKIGDHKKYVPVRPYEKRVVCVNPSTEGNQSSAVTEPTPGPSNYNNVVNPNVSRADKNVRPSASSGPVNPPAREAPSASADANAMVDNEDSTDSRANDETDEASSVWPEPGLARQLDRVVNIFAKEKLVNVPVQSFKYYDTLGNFANKAAVNLRLVFDRSGVADLPADVPVNFNVTVTVGKEEENEVEPNRGSPAGRNRGNTRARKNKMRKRNTKRGAKKGLQRGYILKIKDKYMKNSNNSNEWYVKATNSMLCKAELEKLMEDTKSNALTLSSAGHSDAEQAHDENGPSSNSQCTNCSTEDESCYTQTLKKVSHIYKVEVKPTQSLIEEESEDFSVGTARTPPLEDKENVVADAAPMRKGSVPPRRSLYRSGRL